MPWHCSLLSVGNIVGCGYFLASNHFNVKKFNLKFSTKKEGDLNNLFKSIIREALCGDLHFAHHETPTRLFYSAQVMRRANMLFLRLANSLDGD